MKSPWKFIGNLISRGRSEDPENIGNPEHAQAKASPRQMQESTPFVPPAAEHPADDVPPNRKTEPGGVERDTDGTAVADAPVLGAEAERPKPKQSARARYNTNAMPKRNGAVKKVATRTRGVGRAKKTSTDTVAQRVGTPNDQGGNATDAQVGFQADVEDVDAQVQRFRRQLADALIVQNAQLKKMLERFGVS